MKLASSPPLPSAGLVRAAAPRSWWPAVGVVLIVGITAAAYWPSLRGGYLIDDEIYLTNNELIRAPDGLRWFWFSTRPSDYWPLTNTSFWLEWRLWGMNPAGYHVTNLLLHIAAVFLIWAVLRKLAVPGAFLAALLFAVHPVNVESVAWISQRKNELAIVFFLLSICWYLRAEGQREVSRESSLLSYYLSLFAFVLAMLSKGSVAVLPVVLLLIVWWQRRSRRAGINRWDLIRTGPFFSVAIALSTVNVWFQTHGTDTVIRHVNLVQRLLGAGAVIWFYLSKALAPIYLVFIYPQWQIEAHTLLWWLPLVAALIVTWLLARRRNSSPNNWATAVLFAWLLFCVALAPVLGFTDVTYMYYSLVADHYQHIALVAVVALAAAAWSAWRQRSRGIFRSLPMAVAVATISALTFLTWQQSRLYGDVVALYQQTVDRNPASWIAHNNLATALTNEGRFQEAICQCRLALEAKPDYAEPHCNLGVALARLGNLPAAIAQYQEALRLKPNYFIAHYNLANAQLALGQVQEAIEHYRQALLLEPHDAQTHDHLANALLQTRQFDEAIQHYQTALNLNPNLSDAEANWGVALLNLGRPQEAIEHFRQALGQQPDDATNYFNLAIAYDQLKQPHDAETSAQKALDLARAQGNEELAQQIVQWRADHRSRQSNPDQRTPANNSSPP